MTDQVPHESDDTGLAGFGADLYFGLVRAIGTDLSDAIDALRICVARAGYPASVFKVIKFSAFFPALLDLAAANGQQVPVRLSQAHEGRYEYYRSRMDAGDWLRWALGKDILAQQAVAAVSDTRHPLAASPARGGVFVFDSVMHPAEVELLRSVYGRRFFLIAVHSTAEHRAQRLTDELGSADPASAAPDPGLADLSPDQRDRTVRERAAAFNQRLADQVDELMRRDEGLSEPKSALSPAPPERRVAIRRTFAEADLFVTLKEVNDARSSTRVGVIERFIEKIFDEPFHTPTRAELGMAHAYVAARRSGSLARAVGAAICTPQGDVLAVGTNDVPSAGGGHYWPAYDGSTKDFRDHHFPWPAREGGDLIGVDSNDQVKLEIFNDLVRRILDGLNPEVLGEGDQLSLLSEFKYDADRVVARLFQDDTVQAAKFFDVLEYSRTVHAEMSALSTCARLGIPVNGAILYCTTFPCHECSRHIIAAGISRVVYVEPYPKSRVGELHRDSVVVERFTGPAPFKTTDPGPDAKVLFEPFVGISPTRHPDLYSYTARKIDGRVEDPDYLGRKRHWVLGPDAPLRASLRARLPVIQLAEDVMIEASEQYITANLSAGELRSTTPATESH